LSRSGAVTRIKAILEANSSPNFQVVLIGEPLSIPSGDRVAAAWFSGESEKTKTLGNVMVTQLWTVRCYWRVPSGAKQREKLELEIWDAVRAVQAGFTADSTLTDNITDLDISLASVGWSDIGGNTFRICSFNLEIIDLEAESIAP
tara:strand:- start:5543 stop:5980 length:438 start_codon:yes stop_codon:yes gene_type:complete